MIRVRIGGEVCSVNNGQWTAPIPGMQKVLQRIEDGTINRPPEPDRDHASAVLMAQEFGGKVLDPAKPRHVRGRVY